MLDKSLKDQVAAIFSGLESEYIFEVNASKEHESYNELVDMLEDVVSCSSKLTLRISDGDSIAFSLLKNEEPTGITFRGIPNGHEFT